MGDPLIVALAFSFVPIAEKLEPVEPPIPTHFILIHEFPFCESFL